MGVINEVESRSRRRYFTSSVADKLIRSCMQSTFRDELSMWGIKFVIDAANKKSEGVQN